MSGLPPMVVVDCDPKGWEDLVLNAEVTADLIRQGKPGNCCFCPGALALLAAVQRAGLPLEEGTPTSFAPMPVKVFAEFATLWLRGGRTYEGELPAVLRQFMYHFDHGPRASWQPFHFQIRMVRTDPRMEG